MSPSVLHQFLTGATAGDAITSQAFLMRDWLRDLGFESHVFAQYVHESVAGEVKTLADYKQARGESWTIYHHSIGSDVPQFLARQSLTLLLIYHNITPEQYFTQVDPKWSTMAREGLRQLQGLRDQTGMALADSKYNELDLSAAGYPATAVLPITLRKEHFKEPVNPTTAVEIRQAGPNLLFVGRFCAKQEARRSGQTPSLRSSHSSGCETASCWVTLGGWIRQVRGKNGSRTRLI